MAAALVCGALRHDQPFAAIAPALALVTFTVALFRLNGLFGGAGVPLRFVWTPLALLLLAPMANALFYLRRRVEWRGRLYRLDDDAALAA